jgi:hypothetical protein
MATCAPGRHWANAPQPPNQPRAQRVTGSAVESIAVNGVNGASVNCSVRPNGAGPDGTPRYAIKADISTLEGEPAVPPTTVHLRAVAGSNSSAAAAELSVTNALTGSAVFTDDQCSLSVEGEALGVAAGRIWGSISCDRLIDPATPGISCIVDAGFFIFENCER